MAWTTNQMPDQHGRTVIVTGANSGIGAQTARALASAGARVILACRDPRLAEAMAAPVGGATEVRRLDLADLSAIRVFAHQLDEEVDTLINNAGVLAVPEGLTADGFELHLGINHLGPFLLTGLLLDRVRDRIVTVTSGLHRIARISPQLDPSPRYGRWSAYGRSKLANLLFAYELDRRLKAAGRDIISLAAHPGVASTEGQRRDRSLLGAVLAGGRAQSPEMGALPILYAATAPEVDGGTCIGPDGRTQRRGHPTVVSTSRASRDRELARRVWERSEQLTGHPYAVTAS